MTQLNCIKLKKSFEQVYIYIHIYIHTSTYELVVVEILFPKREIKREKKIHHLPLTFFLLGNFLRIIVVILLLFTPELRKGIFFFLLF